MWLFDFFTLHSSLNVIDNSVTEENKCTLGIKSALTEAVITINQSVLISILSHPGRIVVTFQNVSERNKTDFGFRTSSVVTTYIAEFWIFSSKRLYDTSIIPIFLQYNAICFSGFRTHMFIYGIKNLPSEPLTNWIYVGVMCLRNTKYVNLVFTNNSAYSFLKIPIRTHVHKTAHFQNLSLKVIHLNNTIAREIYRKCSLVVRHKHNLKNNNVCTDSVLEIWYNIFNYNSLWYFAWQLDWFSAKK